MKIRININDVIHFEVTPVDLYIFLPLNRKFVAFAKKNTVPDKLQTLINKNVQHIFIDYGELSTFFRSRTNFANIYSKQFFDAFKSNSSGARSLIKSLIIEIINRNEPPDINQLWSLVCDYISIVNNEESGNIFYALNHLSPYDELSYSQKLATLAVASSILKELDYTRSTYIGLASMFNGIPLLWQNSPRDYIKAEKSRLMLKEFLESFCSINVNCKALQILHSYHSGIFDSHESKIIQKANEIAFFGDIGKSELTSFLK
ncbi:MAG: hypothetical protein JXA66_04025, partial [Oligoflexia bacterium]|nr:hypothetical protein [Oligoflexia bacterium]